MQFFTYHKYLNKRIISITHNEGMAFILGLTSNKDNLHYFEGTLRQAPTKHPNNLIQRDPHELNKRPSFPTCFFLPIQPPLFSQRSRKRKRYLRSFRFNKTIHDFTTFKVRTIFNRGFKKKNWSKTL